MSKKFSFYSILILAYFFIFISEAGADIVYLKNGRNIEGIIKSEDENGIKLNIGFGTVSFRKDEIERIERSSPEESDILRKQWEIRKLETEEKLKKERLTKEREPKRLDILQELGHIIVNATLNKKTAVQLLLDTGASVIVLSYNIGKRLGIDSYAGGNIVQLQMGDGRIINAKYILLESVNVQGVEADNVGAAVLLEDTPDMAFKDGVLGMSFLNRFNFKIDQSKKQLILEKLR
jgi:clan AA aspartic protease (TIGR02281 family)